MTRQDIKITSTDWIPRYQDALYDMLIESIAPQGLFQTEFLAALNAVGSQPDMSLDMLLTYISNRRVAGQLTGIEVHGATLPPAPERSEAPGGIGQAGDGIWFSTPDTNPEGTETTVGYYVNGERKLTRSQDLAVDRSVSKAAIGAVAGDIVQIAIISTADIVGWWGRIEAT